MRTSAKLAAFGGGLLLAFGVALGIGAAVGNPITPSADQPAEPSSSHGGDSHGGSTTPNAVADVPGGLMIAESGYQLQLGASQTASGTQQLRFRVLTDEGSPLTAYQQSHDKLLHLIVVRRDQTGFQHVHPTLAADGTWSSPVVLTPGTWRVFTDFVPGAGPAEGQTITLGADLQVSGSFSPVPLPALSTTATVEGYTVTLTGQLVAGEMTRLTLSVSRDGQPVTDLQPYLAAYGHLVALRAGDLAYLHVHPDGEPGDGTTAAGPDITFYATAPSSGAYRLFLDFRHGDVVRTAEFTAVAEGHS